MSDLIDLKSPAVRKTLNILLKDRATGRNIILATDAYEGLDFDTAITRHLLEEDAVEFVPRVAKSTHEQLRRTRKKAEVFTPSWICNRMNNHCDREYFGREDVFNIETAEEHGWTATEGRIEMPEGCSWRDYVLSRRLEITCGEAPYLVSRYDTASGEPIPIARRIGMLDRKLRLVGEHTRSQRSWNQWAYRAYESTYGYEYQGDSLLMARINLLETFCEYTRDRWQMEPSEASIKRIARIISWNLWQMDGLQNVVPQLGEIEKPAETELLSLFLPEETMEPVEKAVAVNCRLRDWQGTQPREILWGREQGMKFDYVIGNPPYQEDTTESTRKRPIYNYFMEEAYKVSEKVLLITPARFLFDAGQTPKNWNRERLDDKHFKVCDYEADATKIFPNTEIKGGVAITFRDAKKNFGAIKTFTKYPMLNLVLNKVIDCGFESIQSIVSARGCYRFSLHFFERFPDATQRVGVGTGNMIVSNVFNKIPEAFLDICDDDGYLKIIGRENNKRACKYLKRIYVADNPYIETYNVLISEANNTGAFGETLVEPQIVKPMEGATDTFISIGFFKNKQLAMNASKYIKTKFCRAMLGIKKATQHTAKSVWEYVPLQDFSNNADIDWSRSIPQIDQQLYRKYGLSAEEIDFIETHVKEME